MLFNGTTSIEKVGSASDIGSGTNAINAVAEFTNDYTGDFDLHNTSVGLHTYSATVDRSASAFTWSPTGFGDPLTIGLVHFNAPVLDITHSLTFRSSVRSDQFS